MIRIFGTVLAGLLGLAFGSFLNVCLSRWPEGESVVKPRSHCRNCGRTLAWWENVPVVSWIALRGQCRTCKVGISWRYPLVELMVGILWGYLFWRNSLTLTDISLPAYLITRNCVLFVLDVAFGWLLIALAYLDVSNLWLPNWLTYPGIFLGVLYSSVQGSLELELHYSLISPERALSSAVVSSFCAAAAALIVLLIRWVYWLIRRREGIGLGDAKLMALLGAWLGFSGAVLSLAIGVLLSAIYAVNLLATPQAKGGNGSWALSKLPLGAFLCLGGIICVLWGQPIIGAYLRWAGF